MEYYFDDKGKSEKTKVTCKCWLRLKNYSLIHPIMHKNYILVNDCKPCCCT